MGYADKAKIIVIIESVMIGVGVVSLLGLGIYRDSLDQLMLDAAPMEERVEMFEKLGPTKIGFGLFVAAFFLVWLLLTGLLHKGQRMKSFCRVKAWVILQTLFITFIILGLMKEYAQEFYMSYKTVQLAVFIGYRIWTLHVVWHFHHELLEQEESKRQGLHFHEVIEYSRSPTTHTTPGGGGSSGSRGHGHGQAEGVAQQQQQQPQLTNVVIVDKSA